MNGFRKNKGIIIELTSLLDVIMILLFWVMMNVSENADTAEKEAQKKVDAANSQVEQITEDTQKKLDDKDTEVEDMKQSLDEIRSALDGYQNGMMVTMEMKNENGRDVIYLSQNGEVSGSVLVNDSLESAITQKLDSYGLKSDSVILAALVYDGDSVLYRDVDAVQTALDNVKRNFDNLYFTYINTTD